MVHYGTTMGDGAVLAPDSFLMKGEEMPEGAYWGGNPAGEQTDDLPALVASGAAAPAPTRRLRSPRTPTHARDRRAARRLDRYLDPSAVRYLPPLGERPLDRDAPVDGAVEGGAVEGGVDGAIAVDAHPVAAGDRSPA
jgi:hypothetical protein